MNDSLILTTWTADFIITRLIDHRFLSGRCEITMDLDFDSSPSASEAQVHLAKMRNWIETVLDGCVAFNVHCDLNTNLLGEVENHVMFCPGEPTDHLLLLLIKSKLNAIGAGCVVLRACTLSGDNNRGFCTTLQGDPAELLPTAEEWMGPVRYWDESWWNRSDGGMMDLPVTEGDDPEARPDILYDLSRDRKASSIAPVQDDPADAEQGRTAEIIRPNFRPRT